LQQQAKSLAATAEMHAHALHKLLKVAETNSRHAVAAASVQVMQSYR
jgi:hypothetical protein